MKDAVRALMRPLHSRREHSVHDTGENDMVVLNIIVWLTFVHAISSCGAVRPEAGVMDCLQKHRGRRDAIW